MDPCHASETLYPLPCHFVLYVLLQLGDSVVQFFHKTSAEMTGSADTIGAGAKVLVKGLVGGTFGSAAKIAGAFLCLRACLRAWNQSEFIVGLHVFEVGLLPFVSCCVVFCCVFLASPPAHVIAV